MQNPFYNITPQALTEEFQANISNLNKVCGIRRGRWTTHLSLDQPANSVQPNHSTSSNTELWLYVMRQFINVWSKVRGPTPIKRPRSPAAARPIPGSWSRRVRWPKLHHCVYDIHFVLRQTVPRDIYVERSGARQTTTSKKPGLRDAGQYKNNNN